MTVIAWDIETCPVPLDELSRPQKARYQSELEYKLKQKPEMDEGEASRLVRSVHPMLGWICCISAVAGRLGSGPREPKSWSTDSAEGEKELLAEFWQDVREFPRSVTWATFNGKRFDAPFLLARTLRHRLQPTRSDLLDTYPYNHKPHADLSRVWPQYYSLEDLCDHLNINPPKDELDGSLVSGAVDDGRIADVAGYCERDVVATFECLKAMEYVLK